MKEYKALNEYIENNYVDGKENFVLIDEIQMCDYFELCINNLHATEMYDIYITRSNAFSVFLCGVYSYFDLTDKYTAFDNYILEGGMSGSYLYKEQEDKYDYIENVFDTLILKDIRQKVSDN